MVKEQLDLIVLFDNRNARVNSKTLKTNYLIIRKIVDNILLLLYILKIDWQKIGYTDVKKSCESYRNKIIYF